MSDSPRQPERAPCPQCGSTLPPVDITIDGLITASGVCPGCTATRTIREAATMTVKAQEPAGSKEATRLTAMRRISLPRRTNSSPFA
jgi:hypothetical protein